MRRCTATRRPHLSVSRSSRRRTTFPPHAILSHARRACRWFEEAGDGAGGWDIQKITNRIGETDCHVVNEDNVMELNLVDIVGKTTKQKETPSPAERGTGGAGSDSPEGQGSAETSK